MSAIGKTTNTISNAVIAQAKCPEKKECVRRFVEYTDSKGIDRSHPIFRDFDPASHASIVRLKKAIAKVAGEKNANGIMVKYLRDFVTSVPITWNTVFTHLLVGEAFLKEPEASALWNKAKFIEQKALAFLEKNHTSCPKDRYTCGDIYKKLTRTGRVSLHQRLWQKVVPRLKKRGLAYTLEAIGRNIKKKAVSAFTADGAAGIGSQYRTGRIRLHEIGGSLPGFKLFSVMVEGRKMGTMILGDPRGGARAGLRVRVGGEVSAKELHREHEGRVQYQGTLTMQSAEGAMPLGTVVVKGRIHQLRFEDGRQDALVLSFPDGTIAIVDKRRFRLSDITRNPKDSATFLSLTSGQGHVQRHFLEAVEKHKVTILSAASYDPNGEAANNRFEKWGESGGDGRIVFTFKDGKFGVFDTPSNSTNEMLAVLYRMQKTLGSLERVARCDRGMWDTAAYYPKGNRNRGVVLGQVHGDPSNRLYFYSRKRK